MKRSIFKPVGLLAGMFSVFLAGNMQAQDLNSAILLTKSEQYDKSEKMLKELIQKDPTNSKNYFYLGENYLLDYFADTISNSLTVSTKAAQEFYEKGVNANASDPLNYVGLAKVASYLGDEKKAEEMRTKAKSFLLPYKNLKKINPPAKDYAFALAKIAESYITLDNTVDTSKALPLIRQAVTIDPKNASIFIIAGDIYILATDGSNAIKNYNLAQFADPKSPTAAMKIGYIYVKGRALQQAIPNFEEAISLDPNFAPAYRELGQLYWKAQRLEQSKANFKKYLDLSEGNIPAKTRYVNSLFYAGDYEEVIKNVEEILAVDNSRAYMNRLAGYSCFEKENPDYDKAFSYMETLFKTVDPERILKKDYHYMARILLKKNQNYSKMVDELNTLKMQLEKEKVKASAAPAAEKAKYKASVDEMTNKVSNLTAEIAKSNSEIDRGFAEYNKALSFDKGPETAASAGKNRSLLNEMASNYYSFRRYDDAARTWAKLIDPSAANNTSAYMQVGRAYELGENYKAADSIYNIVTKKSPDYLQAYVHIARTYSKQDPDTKLGLAKPKFENVIDVAKSDSIKNADEMMEAFSYLGYYNMENNNISRARDYYNRMINLIPNNKENRIKGYNGLANIEVKLAQNEKTNEGKLNFLGRAAESYTSILGLDPSNASAKSSLKWIQDYQASVRKGINPNEIKGIVTNNAGQPIPYASVRVKDTAAESMTNAKGEYKFEIPQASEVLIFSAKGYKTRELPITKVRVYNVKLEQ